MTLEFSCVIVHGRWYSAGISPEERCVDAGDAGNSTVIGGDRWRTLVQKKSFEHAQKF